MNSIKFNDLTKNTKTGRKSSEADHHNADERVWKQVKNLKDYQVRKLPSKVNMNNSL